ncbi:MAG: ribose-5-phosphate isomerase RpiA [Sandaracinaceae bacterium]|jgi:ribose 5-phosphate isomerase A|nr:ribose-5-phosphate isomerase RpiA [Sandaracinaceae bacterium]
MVEQKRAAARAALKYVPESGVVGLGSGSTAEIFIQELAPLIAAGRKLVGVPSSHKSRALAMSLGIPLLSDDGPWVIDVCFDGADEVDPALDVIKGGGGALTREKVVIAASKKTILLVDASKLSARLGEVWSVPIEVTAFGHASTAAHLRAYGEPVLRMRDQKPFVTDQSGLIYDVKTGPIGDTRALDARLLGIPGVVTTGLFVGMTERVIVAHPDRTEELVRA